MLAPKRIPHRKVQRGSMKGQAKGGTTLNFGTYGIRAEQRHWITNRQIEAARIAMTRAMKRGGKVWITIFPDKPITKKPAETRMGKGKGNPEEWVAVVKPGRIMFEIDGVDDEVAREALRLAQHKLPIKTKIVVRDAADVKQGTAGTSVKTAEEKPEAAQVKPEPAEVKQETTDVTSEVAEVGEAQ